MCEFGSAERVGIRGRIRVSAHAPTKGTSPLIGSSRRNPNTEGVYPPAAVTIKQ